MRVLGAVLAGGQSRRFGSDKAQALLHGQPLIDHVIQALQPQVDALIIVGRAWKDHPMVPDFPSAGGGPLFGLCAALRHGAAQGFEAVLTAGCDVLPVPADLRAQLSGAGAAVMADQPLLGLWPTNLASMLEEHILTQSDHSLRGWSKACAARSVASDTTYHNFNTAADLRAYQHTEK